MCIGIYQFLNLIEENTTHLFHAPTAVKGAKVEVPTYQRSELPEKPSNMIMEDEGVIRPTTQSKDSHYQLSKKVATLTKVIVRLVAANENYEQEINDMKTDAAAKIRLLEEELHDLHEIKNAKIEADERLKVLDAEMRELQEIKRSKAAVDEQLITLRQELQEARAFEANHATQEKESIELLEKSLESVKREAKEATELLDSMKRAAKVELEELKYEQERERAFHAQLVQEQLRQHDENVLRLRNELAEEHKLHMQTLREEMVTSHVDEITLLKSRHEKNIVRLRYEASENEKLAIENAVTRLRLEYEGKLSEQLATTTRKSEEIKAESQIALATLNKAKQSLEGELEKLKLQANEIPILKEKIDILVANEEKLQTQVTRLEMSLDLMSSTNSEVVQGLEGEIDKLRKALNDARETSEKQSKQIGCLEVEVRQHDEHCFHSVMILLIIPTF
jgi:myosin heavy subunit